MRILHIIDSLSLGGAQTMIAGIMEQAQNTPDVFLFVLRRNDLSVKINNQNVVVWNSNSKYSLRPLSAIKKFISNNNIDILHCHLFRAQVFGWFVKRIFCPKIKLIFHEHGRILGSEKNRRLEQSVYRKFLMLAQKNVNLFIAVSKFIKINLIQSAKISENKILVLYNFIELGKFQRSAINLPAARKTFRLSPDDFVIGYIGRLVPRKGWREFVAMAKFLSAKFPKFKFLIAGSGFDEPSLLKTIKENKSIIFLGQVEKVAALYAVLDCLVIPSHWEPLGLIELEAQAMFVPVVASNIPGLNEVITDKQNGLLFQKQDIEDLAEKVVSIYRDKKLRADLTEQGRQTVKNYDIANYMIDLNKIYRQL